MDGSDDETCGFSMFSKKAKMSNKGATAALPIATSEDVKKKTEQIKEEDDRYTFRDLGLNEWVVKCCSTMSIVKPTPVQVFYFDNYKDQFLIRRNIVFLRLFKGRM